MNNNLQPINTIPNFKRFCMTIGELPTSYLETMTYYEMLVWFTEYMKNTIIPTINNNGLAVEELQNKYIELKTFVDNYFTNLDVQEEINNKLDKMVEDGTLENILLNYTSIQKIYNTLQDLINDNNIVNNMKVKVLGYNEINDGGIAEYYITNVINNTKYQVELSNNLYGTLLNNFGNTKVYGNDLNALQKALQYSDYVTMYDDLVITPNTLTISGNKTINFNNHKITMAETTLSYANLISINNGNVIIKNGKIDGNFNHHILSNVTNHTGILCMDGTTIIDNMEIYNCYYEGIILNSKKSKAILKNSYLHHNGRNDVALLSWLEFECDNCVFDYSVDNIEPLKNIDCEPYQADSEMGSCIITNSIFKSSSKCGFGAYLDQNQTSSAMIVLKNNKFYNQITLLYDRGQNSIYYLENNTHHDISNKYALKIGDTIRNVTIKDEFINCTNPIVIDLHYTWGVIKNINIDSLFKGTITKGIEIIVPDGSLSYDYPFDNFNIKVNSNSIINWQYLHNSKVEVPPLFATDNLTLDFNNYYNKIFLIGYDKNCNIDGIFNKSKILGLPIEIYSDVNNNIISTLLPTIGNIGANGLKVPQNGSSFSIKFHNYNYNKFIVDNITGNYTARNT